LNAVSPPFRVVIPARLASSRLAEKLLLPLGTKPVLQHVFEAAGRSGAMEVVIATDSERIAALCRMIGADVELTRSQHQSGTDRIDEVAQRRGWNASDIVVNLQGDEPLMPPPLVAAVAQLLVDHAEADIATLCHPLHTLADWLNPNHVKVVLDRDGRALYFSRAPIPWLREGSSAVLTRLPQMPVYRHIGLYAYRVGALRRFSALPTAPLEQTEALEQLRAVWNGMRIQVGIAAEAPPHGVDTAADLEALQSRFS
jgi:3-deoxy-manno-octulosonate cytidylyltransferase (CMP-KDO synthetase)